MKVKTEKELHLRMAEVARQGIWEDATKDIEFIKTIAVDLMKTLPIPNIATGVACYKRQL